VEPGEITLVRVTTAGQIEVCEKYWREYGDWAVAEYRRLTGDVVEPDHDGFHDELPMMLGHRGRLYLAELEGEPVATGAIKPVDATSGEIKRMYVRPHARGKGISRRMLTQLLADAAEIGYPRVRLDTLRFMTEAQALYRSFGFVDAEPYTQSETARAGVGDHTVYMELTLPRGEAHAKGSE
jgi:N-acetylglutamate synthase and related acetyltransferases